MTCCSHNRLVCVFLAALLLPALLHAASISVNFSLGINDNNSVDIGESAVLAPGSLALAGSAWNHLQLRSDGVAGAPTLFTSASQGGASIALRDDAGSPTATLTSSGTMYTQYSDATSQANRGVTGTSGLMQSYVNLDGTESVTISGLGPAFTSRGYRVNLFFEIGDGGSLPLDRRVYGWRLTAGGASADVWTDDSAGTDSDANDDGVFEWIAATGTTEASATLDANYAVFTNLTASTFTLTGLTGTVTGGRSVLSGMQIVAEPAPPPSLLVAFHQAAASRDAFVPTGVPVAPGSVADPSARHWNHLDNGGSTAAPAFGPLTLRASDGSITTASLSGAAGYAGANALAYTGQNKDWAMMEGWFGLKGAESLTVSGLPAAFTNGFHLIVYGDSNDTNRLMSYTAQGATAQINDTGTFSGTFVDGQNRIVLEGLSGASFTLTGNAAASSRSAICALEIVPGPLPRPPRIEAFRAADQYVAPGEILRLNWSVQGADGLRLDPEGLDLATFTQQGTGTFTRVATATTNLTLVASNSFGVTRADLRVGVGPERPNIVLFLVDDMGWMDTSEPFQVDATGADVTNPRNLEYRTPNLRTLADQGMKFSQAYAQPVCTPTRVSLMTGMNAARHRVTSWTAIDGAETGANTATLKSPPAWRRTGMDAAEIPLPRLLAAAGYRTLHCGKAHFGSIGAFAQYPQALGFDVNIAGSEIGNPASYLGTANFGTGTHHVPGLEAYHGQDIFLTEALTREMKTAISRSVADGAPFFAYFPHYAVHSPFTADPRFSANYQGLTGSALAYATLIEGMDKSLGDILSHLQAEGVDNNTLIVFMSDNGGDNPRTPPEPPLRDKKGMLYEGGIRVPLVIGWAGAEPGNAFQAALPIPANSVHQGIVHAPDLFPTLLGVAGVPFSHAVDGVDLRPILVDPASTARPQNLLIHQPHRRDNGSYSMNHASAWRDGPWKIVYRYEDASVELYNLDNDLGETTNLATLHPERVLAMTRAMTRALRGMNALYPARISDSSAVPPVMPDLPSVDTDDDGLADVAEDADRDGLAGPGETDPDKPDTDGDRTPDGAEIRIGTDPLNPGQMLRVYPERAGPGWVLRWPSAPGAVFTVQTAPSPSGPWTDLQTNIPADAGSTTQFTLPADAPVTNGCFLLILQP